MLPLSWNPVHLQQLLRGYYCWRLFLTFPLFPSTFIAKFVGYSKPSQFYALLAFLNLNECHLIVVMPFCVRLGVDFINYKIHVVYITNNQIYKCQSTFFVAVYHILDVTHRITCLVLTFFRADFTSELSLTVVYPFKWIPNDTNIKKWPFVRSVFNDFLGQVE